MLFAYDNILCGNKKSPKTAGSGKPQKSCRGDAYNIHIGLYVILSS